MSRQMEETDWTHVLSVFRACLPRRGRKARDDRRFLEALHFFTVENLRWRALPERFGPWNSLWKRFERLSKAGVFEAFFDALAAMSSSAQLDTSGKSLKRAFSGNFDHVPGSGVASTIAVLSGRGREWISLPQRAG